MRRKKEEKGEEKKAEKECSKNRYNQMKKKWKFLFTV